jgi:hypothetical protein
MIYDKMFIEKESGYRKVQLIHISALWKVASVVNCDYSEKKSLIQTIMILISILKMFTNFHFERKESVSHMPKNISNKIYRFQ